MTYIMSCRNMVLKGLDPCWSFDFIIWPEHKIPSSDDRHWIAAKLHDAEDNFKSDGIKRTRIIFRCVARSQFRGAPPNSIIISSHEPQCGHGGVNWDRASRSPKKLCINQFIIFSLFTNKSFDEIGGVYAFRPDDQRDSYIVRPLVAFSKKKSWGDTF